MIVASASKKKSSPQLLTSMKVVLFGTHPKQFNGYSKVVYELIKQLGNQPTDIQLHVFGFQNFYNHPGHRVDIPEAVAIHDAFKNEEPKAQGFGPGQVQAYVERIQPDVCIILNDVVILTMMLSELKKATNRKQFKAIAYIDQVYLCQKTHFITFLNQNADAAIAFTPEWRDCIRDQGLVIPCHVLAHGINPNTYYPIPRHLPRRFYGLNETDFLILNLNRNQPRKRWDTCIQAFSEVIARRPDAPIRMVIATEINGAWNLLEILVRELKKRGVAKAEEVATHRVIIPGHPQQLTDEETNVLMNLADIGINTCDGEGFGLCNFEQAAIGIPQIVPNLGGFKHFFRHNETALMIDPIMSIYVDASRDGVGGEALLTKCTDYADAILTLYDNPSLRERLGRASRAELLKRFHWKNITANLLDILNPMRPSPSADADAPIRICASPPPSTQDPRVAEEIAALRARLAELGAT